jgi:hypothetical protein
VGGDALAGSNFLQAVTCYFIQFDRQIGHGKKVLVSMVLISYYPKITSAILPG